MELITWKIQEDVKNVQQINHFGMENIVSYVLQAHNMILIKANAIIVPKDL